MDTYETVSTDTQPASPLSIDSLIARSGGMPVARPGQSVVVEETTTRRVYFLGGQEPAFPSASVQPEPMREVPALPPSRIDNYRSSDGYRYLPRDDYHRRTVGEWFIDFLISHYIGLTITVVLGVIVTVVGIKVMQVADSMSQYTHDHASTITSFVVGVPVLILLIMLASVCGRGGGKCPGVVTHCPVKH